VLRELYAWREQRARLADRPPFKVVAPDVLLALAADSPTTLEDIEDALASFPRQRDQAEVVLAAIQRGLVAPEPEREQRGKPPSKATLRLVDKLREWRDGEAKRTGLDPSIILPTKLLERIALAAPTSLVELAAVDGMRRWRVAKWGAGVVAITSTLA
jgi:ribonuclease D